MLTNSKFGTWVLSFLRFSISNLVVSIRGVNGMLNGNVTQYDQKTLCKIGKFLSDLPRVKEHTSGIQTIFV